MAKTQKTDIYVWEGIDKAGKRRTGELSAQTEALAKAMIRRQGVNPLKVKKKPKPRWGVDKTKIASKDITVFSRQLATMVSSGVPLVQAFEIIGRGHENAGMQELILNIKADVESGNNLTESLSKHPLYFNELYCNLVAAGEHAGILESVLHKLAIYMEKSEALKSKVKSAMFYPIIVLAFAAIVVSILLIFVIPQFGALFNNFGADLPALTQLLIDTSDFFVENWFWIFLVISGVVFGFLEMKKRSLALQHFIDRTTLRTPVFGVILEKSAIARFARTLETMFAAGTPLVEAMASAAGACGNIIFYNATMKMKDEISTGTQLQVAMRDSGLFPSMVVQMVAIGEESGAVDSMLGKVADWYEEQVDDAVSGLTSLLEPVIIAFLGIVIGTIVIGMYLPIFKLGAVV